MSKAGERILTSAREALVYARGEMTEGFVAHVPRAVDVRAVRAKTGLSQERFAQRIGVPVGTLRGWEQGRRQPEGPARVLLALLDRNPRVVKEMLGVDL